MRSVFYIAFWFGLAFGATELVAESLSVTQAKKAPAYPILAPDKETMEARGNTGAQQPTFLVMARGQSVDPYRLDRRHGR
jgi:hypothetical protein